MAQKLTVHISNSEAETFQLGEAFGRMLQPPCIVLFHGELGTGKTVFIRGICAALGWDSRRVRSPSFTLINQYPGRCPITHVDLYRLSGAEDLDSIGLDEILASPGVVLVEWAELLGQHPEAYLVQMKHIGEDSREVRIQPPAIGRDSPRRKDK